MIIKKEKRNHLQDGGLGAELDLKDRNEKTNTDSSSLECLLPSFLVISLKSLRRECIEEQSSFFSLLKSILNGLECVPFLVALVLW